MKRELVFCLDETVNFKGEKDGVLFKGSERASFESLNKVVYETVKPLVEKNTNPSDVGRITKIVLYSGGNVKKLLCAISICSMLSYFLEVVYLDQKGVEISRHNI